MADHSPPPSDQAQRRARLRPGIRVQPGMRPGMWYPVVERNPVGDKRIRKRNSVLYAPRGDGQIARSGATHRLEAAGVYTTFPRDGHDEDFKPVYCSGAGAACS
jgi:hypothetical protein